MNVTMPLSMSEGSGHSAAEQGSWKCTYKSQTFIHYRPSICAHKCTAALQYILMHTTDKWHVAGLYSLSVLTSAKWCCRLKCCRVAIHCSCTCCHCISDQFKAGITGVGSSVTNGVASECHHAIVNVSRIRTQCYRARCHKYLSTTDTSI